MQKSEMKPHSAFRSTAIHLVWVIVLVTACLLLPRARSARIAIAKEEDGFSVVTPDGSRDTVRYGDITLLQLLSSAEWPAISVENQRGKVTWSVTEDGTSIALLEGIPVAILLQQKENTLLFNYENEQATQLLFEQIQSMIPGQTEAPVL